MLNLCDSHIHVFDKGEVQTSGAYLPPKKGITEFVQEACVANMGRAVLIQASVNGTDNSHLLRTLAEPGKLALRGVVMVDEDSHNLGAMSDLGVVALRVQDRSLVGIRDFDRVVSAAHMGAEQGWHVELNTEPDRFEALLGLLPTLPQNQPLVLDHMGHCDPESERDRSQLYRLLDTGRVWVKLAPTRVTRHPTDLSDLTTLVSELASRYTERCVWGSDWPHVMTEEPLPQSEHLLACYQNMMTSAQFDACLSHNPAVLYRFD